MAWYTAVALCAGAALIATAMIPAWLDPEVTMAHDVTYGECAGGPKDGHRQAVPEDCDLLWIGPARAAWVIESGVPPESVVGDDLVCYRWDGQVKDDGTRIYEWVEPG